ncbi:MAG: DUF4920 domain-containing protein [Gilvibacter sp.]
MKKIALLIVCISALIACKSENKEDKTVIAANEVSQSYRSFGQEITASELMTLEEVVANSKKMVVGDTIPVKFSSKVEEVCQNKGCWMKVNVGGELTMVRFKDYGFFMPKDIAGQEAIIKGMAFIEEESVEQQRHYAEDAGKSAEEIAAITEPKKQLAVLSSGVLLPEIEE